MCGWNGQSRLLQDFNYDCTCAYQMGPIQHKVANYVMTKITGVKSFSGYTSAYCQAVRHQSGIGILCE